jgi:hypothetical protein
VGFLWHGQMQATGPSSKPPALSMVKPGHWTWSLIAAQMSRVKTYSPGGTGMRFMADGMQGSLESQRAHRGQGGAGRPGMVNNFNLINEVS